MICQNCQSDNTQKVSLIYESGTSHILTNSSTVGAGVGNGVMVGGAATSTMGTSRSLLAEKVAPLQKNSYSLASVLLAISVSIMAGLWMFVGSSKFDTQATLLAIVALFLFGLGVKMILVARQYNATVYPQKYAEWTKYWHCNKCGTIYTE